MIKLQYNYFMVDILYFKVVFTYYSEARFAQKEYSHIVAEHIVLQKAFKYHSLSINYI